MFKTYHDLSIKKLSEELHSSVKGLTSEEANKRLKRFGLNKLPEEKKFTLLGILWRQIRNPLIYILFAAAVISFFLNHLIDALIVLAAAILSVVIGLFQEYKADRAIWLLKQAVRYKAKVWRDDIEKVIPVEEIAPGDIIILDPGDRVPADARLLETHNLQVIEASLTGESAPSNKRVVILDKETPLADRENMVYMGTVVARGKARAIVCQTGAATAFGHITLLLKEVKEEKTPLQKQLARFAQFWGVIILALASFIFLIGLFLGRDIFEMFLISVAVAVAAVPEGLLPAMTVVLAVGMQRILKQKGLIRKLVASETLGSVSVICSDKTGTLTEGKMKVTQIVTDMEKPDGHYFPNKIGAEEPVSHITALRIGLLCNDTIIENPEDDLHKWKITGDPTERALLLAGTAVGLNKFSLEKEMPRFSEIPFDTSYKYMATLHQISAHKAIIFIKGAPERILERAEFIDMEGDLEKLTVGKLGKVTKQYEDLTRKGLRVLAVGYKNVSLADFKERDLAHSDLSGINFVGFIGLKDPLREEAKEAIKLCRSAGIRPIIVTGDHRLTTRAIAQELGLKFKEKNILEGKDIEKLSDEKLKEKVKEIIIYARVEPKHKLRIVRAWQSRGEVVAMTGDGVNDAPALKLADIGVALGSGTDVVKEVADLILLSDNFKVIVSAIKQGRIIFNNIRKVILFLLSDSFTEIFLVAGSIFLGLPLPLVPAQILWVNLIEDSLPAVALAMEKADGDIMKEKPRHPKEPILNRDLKIFIALFSIVTDLALFGLFIYFWRLTNDLVYARTIVFVGLAVDSLFYIFALRNLKHSFIHLNPFKNLFLVFSVIFGMILLIAAIHWPILQNVLQTVPLAPREWFILIIFGILNLLLIELGKWYFIIKRK